MKSIKEIIYKCLLEADFNGEELDTIEISNRVGVLRSNCSMYLNKLVEEKKIIKCGTRPIIYKVPKKEIYNFSNFIGCNDYFKAQINTIKSSFISSDFKSSILVSGGVGSGKSYLISEILKYLLSINNSLNEDYIIKIDAKYYVNKHIDIEEAKKGMKEIFSRSKNKILVIENIDFISIELRANFIEMLENNKDNVTIIASISYSNNKDLVNTYKSRFLTCLNLDNYFERTIDHKAKLIEHFIIKYQNRVDKKIYIDNEVFKALIFYNFPNNLEQLNEVIYNSILNYSARIAGTENSKIEIYLNDVPSYLKSQNDKYRLSKEVDSLNYDFVINSSSEKFDSYVSFYKQNINNYLSNGYEIRVAKEQTVYRMMRIIENFSHISLDKIKNDEIRNLARDIVYKMSKESNKVYSENNLNLLTIYLYEIEKISKLEVLIGNEQLDVIINTKNYFILKTMKQEIEAIVNVDLNNKLIALMTCIFGFEQNYEAKVLIIMHGDNLAESFKNTIKQLDSTTNEIYHYNLLIDDNLGKSYVEILDLMKTIKNDYGILVLYDMGSIKNMVKKIARENNIKISTIEIPSTLLMLETINKSKYLPLNEVCDEVLNENLYNKKSNKIIMALSKENDNACDKIKRYIETFVSLENTIVISYSTSNVEYLKSEISRITKSNALIAICGTYDPKLFDINFIYAHTLYETQVNKLNDLLSNVYKNSKVLNFDKTYDYLNEELIYLDLNKNSKLITKVIESMSVTFKLNENQQYGMLMHLCCAMNRLIQGLEVRDVGNKYKIISTNKKTYYRIIELLSPLEKKYNIYFDESTYASILTIIKKI